MTIMTQTIYNISGHFTGEEARTNIVALSRYRSRPDVQAVSERFHEQPHETAPVRQRRRGRRARLSLYSCLVDGAASVAIILMCIRFTLFVLV